MWAGPSIAVCSPHLVVELLRQHSSEHVHLPTSEEEAAQTAKSRVKRRPGLHLVEHSLALVPSVGVQPVECGDLFIQLSAIPISNFLSKLGITLVRLRLQVWCDGAHWGLLCLVGASVEEAVGRRRPRAADRLVPHLLLWHLIDSCVAEFSPAASRLVTQVDPVMPTPCAAIVDQHGVQLIRELVQLRVLPRNLRVDILQILFQI
mmetsp:Transcript_17434/g.41036  ORF Transcript_17434/g.41036 Transcript_17434/m.41036 type:complete len:205 (-) Transcript_17434:392-1006(-)